MLQPVRTPALELPGVYGNGTNTLGENIADLGGVQMAYQAYNTKLLSEGSKDEELQKKQGKFFQSYANLWRVKYTSEYALKRLDDDMHSRQRTYKRSRYEHGWYDLYDAQWGGKLHLKPEKRLYIW